MAPEAALSQEPKKERMPRVDQAKLLCRTFATRVQTEAFASPLPTVCRVVEGKGRVLAPGFVDPLTVPVIVQPAQNLPSSFEGLNSRLDAAALLSGAGVKVLFSTMGEPHMVRTLAQEAGNAVAWGLPYADAVRAITSNVTETFGLEGGQVAPGQVADLVLWNGDPLDVSSRPLGMWVGGKQVPLTSRQRALFEKYSTLAK